MTVHVYCGPTISAEQVVEQRPDAVVHPPIQHGDLMALSPAEGDVIVIVDGLYHQRPPVRHKEILHAMQQGATVVGCSSMGAMRAAELHPLGMVGHGEIFAMYRDGVIEADDEVAVAHQVAGSLDAQNVPLINVRIAVEHAVADGIVSREEADRLTRWASSIYYPQRTWDEVEAVAGDEAEVVWALRSYLQQHPEHADQKKQDAVNTLRALDDLVAGAPRHCGNEPWTNHHYFTWLAEFTLVNAAEPSVSAADVVRHAQIFSPLMPRLWQDFVIAALRKPGEASLPAETVAVARMTEMGAYPDLPPTAVTFLTDEEKGALSPEEAALRIMVRAFEPLVGIQDLVEAVLDVVDVNGAVRMTRESVALNSQVRWRGGGRLVERLSEQQLLTKLRTLWGAEDMSREQLLAAARDRGMPTLERAMTVMRVFLLRTEQQAGRRLPGQMERCS